MQTPDINLWQSAAHALDYLSRADTIPHRTEGEAVLLDLLPESTRSILDLGCGAGRLLALAKLACPDARAVALDFSPTMIQQARERFGAEPSIRIVAHDLNYPLPALGTFDAVISSFAIHHLPHERKRALYDEAFQALNPGGVFCNFEHVASPTAAVHEQFLRELSIVPADEDPSNKLLDVQTQLRWLSEIGFEDVDCYWKWRELAVLAGVKREA